MSEQLDKLEVHTEAPAVPAIRPYDFRAKRSGSLDTLHGEFAAALAASLCDHLRGRVEIRFCFEERLRYDEFIYSLGEISCLSVLRVDPPGAQACLDFGSSIIFPIIDRLLGGQSDATAPLPHRPLTQIEQGLALQVIERSAARLAETWGQVAPLSVREESLESTPAAVRIMPGDEVVSVARFEVRLASGSGTMSLCVPDPVTQYLRELPPPLLSPAERDAAKEKIQGNLLESAVELRALLAETRLRLGDVLDMQVGDVITTDKPVAGDVPVNVEGTDKFQGRLGQLGGARAVRITRSERSESGASA